MLPGNKDIKGCSDKVVSHLNLNTTQINQCYQNSFYDFDKDGTQSDNHIL